MQKYSRRRGAAPGALLYPYPCGLRRGQTGTVVLNLAGKENRYTKPHEILHLSIHVASGLPVCI